MKTLIINTNHQFSLTNWSIHIVIIATMYAFPWVHKMKEKRVFYFSISRTNAQAYLEGPCRIHAWWACDQLTHQIWLLLQNMHFTGHTEDHKHVLFHIFHCNCWRVSYVLFSPTVLLSTLHFSGKGQITNWISFQCYISIAIHLMPLLGKFTVELYKHV